MFSKKKDNFNVSNKTATIINCFTKINGDIISDENIRIDGQFDGTIFSKARVVIGEAAVVKGNINSIDAEVSGNLHGNISVENLLILRSKAKIHGDIISKKLIIEEGAEFAGAHKVFEAVEKNEELCSMN